MNEIANLNYDFNGHTVRVVGTYDEPWFIAQDVCEHLGLENVSETVNGRADRPGSGLDEDERGYRQCLYPLRNQHGEFEPVEQQMLVVSESGLYSLIFKSRKQEAKAFKRWVTHEVLPSIRKTGGYIHDMELFLTHQVFRDLQFHAMEMTDKWCLEMLKYHLGPHMVEWFTKQRPNDGLKLAEAFMAEAKKFLSTFLPDGEGGLKRFPKAWRKGRASIFIDSAQSLEEGHHSYWMQYKHAGANKPTLEEHILKVCYCPREGTRPPEIQHLLDMQSTPTLEGAHHA